MDAQSDTLTTIEIMAATDRRIEKITVPGWPKKIIIGTMSRQQVIDIAETCAKPDGGRDWVMYEKLMIVNGIVSPQISLTEVEEIWKRNSYAIEFVLNKIYALSKITREGYINAEAVGAAEEQFPG